MTTNRSAWNIQTIRNGNSSFDLLNLMIGLWVAHESSWLCFFFECSGELIGETSRCSEESDWIVAYNNAELSKQACSQDGSLFQWWAGSRFSSLLNGWWRLEHQSRDSKLKTILIWRKRATIWVLVFQGSAWEGNGERTVWFRRCPAAVKPLLHQARVSQNARQISNRRGSTCFFWCANVFAQDQMFWSLLYEIGSCGAIEGTKQFEHRTRSCIC